MKFRKDKKPSGLLGMFHTPGVDIIDKGCVVGRISGDDVRITLFTEDKQASTGAMICRIDRTFISHESAKDWLKKNWADITARVKIRYERE